MDAPAFSLWWKLDELRLSCNKEFRRQVSLVKARSESHLPPKSETRNPKVEIQRIHRLRPCSGFRFVSDFGFRVSGFERVRLSQQDLIAFAVLKIFAERGFVPAGGEDIGV